MNFDGPGHKKIWAKIAEKDFVGAELEGKKHNEVVHRINQSGDLMAAAYHLIKERRGLDMGTMRFPLKNASDDQKKILDDLIQNWQWEK